MLRIVENLGRFAFPLALDRWGVEQPRVGGFVPRPDPTGPAPASIDVAQCLPERQDAVIAGEVERLHLLRRADGAMMRIVEQQAEAAAALAHRSDRRNQRRLVPFVDDDQVGTLDERCRIGVGVVGFGRKFRICLPEWLQTILTRIRQEIVEAPVRRRLQRSDLMTR